MIWISGFNGFQQIDKYLETVAIKSPKICNIDAVQCCSQCLITWSQIVFINEKKTLCSTNLQETNGCSHAKEAKCDAATNVGEDLVFLMEKKYIFISGNVAEEWKELTEYIMKEDRDKMCQLYGTDTNLLSLTDDGTIFVWEVVGVKEGLKIPTPLEMTVKAETVSCGKEHTVVLGKDGQVYTFGGGSRGQLGNDDTIISDAPVPVEALAGVRCTMVAAGGWHSLAVSEFNDLYVWGWNESGQLGLPCSNDKNYPGDDQNIPSSPVENCIRDYDTVKAQDKQGTLSSVDENDKRTPCCSELSLGREATHVDQDENTKNSAQTVGGDQACYEQLQKEDVQNMTCIQNKASLEDKKCHNDQKDFSKTDQSINVTCSTESSRSSDPGFSNTTQQKNDTKDKRNCLVDDQKHSTDIDQLESRLFIQDVDPVQIQTIPCAIDFVEDVTISKISCGTRHTAILTGEGLLLTCGWNSYGQLCHGDTNNRDYFQTVDMFTKSKTKVKDIYCGGWNTVIITD